MSKDTVKKNIHVTTGDTVIVTSGKDKGKTGNVREVNTKTGKVLVDGVNMVTKAQKANPMAGVQGGLNKVARPVDASKLMIYCPSCSKATRVRHEIKDGKKVRICIKCGEKIDA